MAYRDKDSFTKADMWELRTRRLRDVVAHLQRALGRRKRTIKRLRQEKGDVVNVLKDRRVEPADVVALLRGLRAVLLAGAVPEASAGPMFDAGVAFAQSHFKSHVDECVKQIENYYDIGQPPVADESPSSILGSWSKLFESVNALGGTVDWYTFKAEEK